jgi:hypothetical protein
VEIVNNGNALLADASKSKILNAFDTLYAKTDFTYPELYGDGDAASFICHKILEDL